jgi:AraC-like DNA-binding protein
MEFPDRPIVVTRPGSLVDGLVGGRDYTPGDGGPSVIAGGSFIVYVVRGEGWFRSANVSGPIRPGTLICAPPGPFDCEVSGSREALVVALAERPDRTNDPRDFTVPFLRHLSHPERAEWHGRLTAMLELARDDGVRDEHVDALKRDLAPLVWRKRAPYAQETLENVFGLLWKRRAEPIALEPLATAVGYTPNYLSELVSTHTGRPLGKWIADIRMARARHDLEFTDVPVAEIGAASGYEDPAYFSRAFRRFHGVPPALWRLAKRPSAQERPWFTVSIDELKHDCGRPAAMGFAGLTRSGDAA